MTTQQSTQEKAIAEGNRIIAEFMGWYQLPEVNKGSNLNWFHEVYTPKVLNNIDVPTDVTQLGFKYHWSLLMPVVEKIASTVIKSQVSYNSDQMVRVEIVPEGYVKISNLRDTPIFANVSIEKSLINATYKACVEFIKWHNAKLAEPC